MIALGNFLAVDRRIVERWFDRSIRHGSDPYGLCEAKLLYLSPCRSGSYRETLDFGRQCLATGDWEHRLPFILVEAHVVNSRWKNWRLSADPDPAYFKSPAVWKDVQAVYEPYLEKNLATRKDRTLFARYACWAGQFEVARKQFEILGSDADADSVGGTDNLELLRRMASQVQPPATTQP